MELTYAAHIDSSCARCGASEAVDWCQVNDGTRRYACRSCLEDLLRYAAEDTTLAALPDTPQAVLCPECERFTREVDTGPANRCPGCATPETGTAFVEAVVQHEDAGPRTGTGTGTSE